jgi:hypothetical protein
MRRGILKSYCLKLNKVVNGVHINAVSFGMFEESLGYFSYFPRHIPVAMDEVKLAYIKSVLGFGTRQVIKVY